MRTDKQQAFIEHYVQTGNATKSAIMAGYSERGAEGRGHNLKKQFAGEIAEETRKGIVDAVPGALAQLKELAYKAESESVRFQAVKDILDRAGLKPVDKIEQTTIEQVSTEELHKELESLLMEDKPEVVGITH